MSVIPAIYNIKTRQGSTFSKSLTVSVSGTPLNLTGAVVRMQVRSTSNSNVAVLDLSTTNGSITKIDNSGKISINVSASRMEKVAAGSYRYDIEVVSADGEVTALLEGSFTVTPKVTR